MDSKKIVEQLKQMLGHEKYDYTFDEKHDKLRLEHKQLKRGMDISVAGIVSKYEVKQEAAISEILYTISQTFDAMEKEAQQGHFIKFASAFSNPQSKHLDLV